LLAPPETGFDLSQCARRHHDGRSKDSDVNEEIPIEPQVEVEKGSRNGGDMRTVAFLLGALAVGKLEIRKARLREVEIDSLTVRRFSIADEDTPEKARNYSLPKGGTR
jgi:hypothetical protein